MFILRPEGGLSNHRHSICVTWINHWSTKIANFAPAGCLSRADAVLAYCSSQLYRCFVRRNATHFSPSKLIARLAMTRGSDLPFTKLMPAESMAAPLRSIAVGRAALSHA